MDRLLKYANFMTLRHPFTTLNVETIFIKEVVRLHEFTISMVSDWDKVFMSTFWREPFRVQETNFLRSIAYHPQTDGKTKIFNKTLEQ